MLIFPGLLWAIFPEGMETLRANLLGVSGNPLGWGDGKECLLKLISRPLEDPGAPLPGPLFNFPRALSGRLSTTRPLGCTVGWFRGRLFWTTSQAARGPARGDSPGSKTRREGTRERGWEGQGWGVGARAWPPWGQDPPPTQHPQRGLAVLGA